MSIQAQVLEFALGDDGPMMMILSFTFLTNEEWNSGLSVEVAVSSGLHNHLVSLLPSTHRPQHVTHHCVSRIEDLLQFWAVWWFGLPKEASKSKRTHQIFNTGQWHAVWEPQAAISNPPCHVTDDDNLIEFFLNKEDLNPLPTLQELSQPSGRGLKSLIGIEPGLTPPFS